MKFYVVLFLFFLWNFYFLLGQYNSVAGVSAPKSSQKDNYGNAKGNEYDLATDKAFENLNYKNVKTINTLAPNKSKNNSKEQQQKVYQEYLKKGVVKEDKYLMDSDNQTIIETEPLGSNSTKPDKANYKTEGYFTQSTILVLQLYTEPNFDFVEPTKALEQKGFSVYRYIGNAPSPDELKRALELSTQLWVISDNTSKLSDEHIKIIKDFFHSGKGLYLWADNDPYFADINKIIKELFNAEMNGNYMGDHVIKLKDVNSNSGITPNHLLSTGIENIYEGITISNIITQNKDLKPLMYDSQGNVLASIYEKEGKRCIIDGGFTRLYYKWNTAGTDRYIKNAAAWLANIENNLKK